MAGITDFKSAFPELATLDDAVIDSAINRAEFLHDATDRGTLLAAAHLIATDSVKASAPAPDGGMGVVRREKIGQQETEYETNAGGEDWKAFWSITPYGRELLQIEARNVRQGFGILIA